MSYLAFTVYGTPVPQGSSRAFIPKGWERPVITAANAKTKPWRQEIAGTAKAEMETYGVAPMLAGEPVWISVEFFFEKPRSISKRVTHKTTKPDIDKLLRAVLDSLTGIVFKDDSQVCSTSARKRFGSPARVEIVVMSP